MLARVVRWENARAEGLEESAARIRDQVEAEGGPPPDVPAKELLLLQDAATGKAIAVTLFETEEDYRQGDETLNAMDPPGEGMGQRVAVEKYELVLRVEA